MEVYWIVLFLVTKPGETPTVSESFHGQHMATLEQCLRAAADLARDEWTATRCEKHVKPHKPLPVPQPRCPDRDIFDSLVARDKLFGDAPIKAAPTTANGRGTTPHSVSEFLGPRRLGALNFGFLPWQIHILRGPV
jgi:hypothetical protein